MSPVHPIDTTDTTRPDGVEGRMHQPDRVYDKDSDTFKVSQVHLWMDFSVAGEVVEKAKKLTVSDGLLSQAIDRAYNAALVAEIAAQKAAHPEYTDEEAREAALSNVTKANVATIWANLQSTVSAEQADDAARAAVADTIVQSLLAKNTGTQSWGIRLLKYAWNGKGL